MGKRNDNIGILAATKDSCVTVAIIEEIREVDARQYNQSRRVDECEREAESAESDDYTLSYVFGGGFPRCGQGSSRRW